MATPATDTELREVLTAIARLESTAAANHAAITQRVEVGFAQIDAKFAQMDTKLAEAKAELKGEIQRVESKMDVGFAEVDTKFAHMDTKLDAKIAELGGKIDVLNERTKLGFWGFIGRGVFLSILGGLALAAIRFTLYAPLKISP